ncbi:uncharacterized protein LOC110913663 [Helianthus annuus]|uniref:uncharacterized protein LOC110913663 n=1 Tax=Helianthus annuus TaxID=4232 RepID=UPI000B907989|nr:uncharacterized protein LOC110913663 [Helianthus annuus]
MEAASPTTIEETYRLTARLNGNHVMRKNTSKTPLKTAHQATIEPTDEPSKKTRGKKRKASSQNCAVVTPLNPQPLQAMPAIANDETPRRGYTGTQPKCGQCQYHHPPNVQCRKCAKCGRYGHTSQYCRVSPQAYQNQALLAPNQVAPVRACFTCGDTNHMANVCPQRHQPQQQQPQPQQ